VGTTTDRRYGINRNRLKRERLYHINLYRHNGNGYETVYEQNTIKKIFFELIPISIAPNNNFKETICQIIAPCNLNIKNSQILNGFLRFSIGFISLFLNSIF